MPINNEMERMLSSRQEQLVLCPAVNDQPFGGIVYVNGGSSIYTMSSNVEKSPLWRCLYRLKGELERWSAEKMSKKATLILVFEVLSEFTAKSKVLIVPKWKWTFFSNF